MIWTEYIEIDAKLFDWPSEIVKYQVAEILLQMTEISWHGKKLKFKCSDFKGLTTFKGLKKNNL